MSFKSTPAWPWESTSVLLLPLNPESRTLTPFLSKSVRSVVLSASQTTSFHTTPDKIKTISASVQCVFVITRSNTHFCNTRLRRVYKLFHKKTLKTQNFLIFCGLLRGTRGDVQINTFLRKTKSGVRNATKCMFLPKMLMRTCVY